MNFSYDFNGCFADKVGQSGLDRVDYNKVLGSTDLLLDKIAIQNIDNSLPLLGSIRRDDDIASIENFANKIKNEFEFLVILGTGGSILNPRLFVDFARFNTKQSLKIFLVDNVDPEYFDYLLSVVELEKTAFLAISKSGSTIETLSQSYACLEILKKYNLSIAKHFFAISDPIDSPLRRLCSSIDSIVLDHDIDIGGRFSGFTNVGLLPAALVGLDIGKIRQGGIQALDATLSREDNFVAESAAISYLFYQKDITNQVVMSYKERLCPLIQLCRQLYSESLGKDGNGFTMIDAKGSLDQHSQLQLYLDGKNDKFFTIIYDKTLAQGAKIVPIDSDADTDYLNARTIGDTNYACARSTIDSLTKANRPVKSIIVDTLDELLLGQMAACFMLETILTAGLFGVDPFDQPAVEDGKIIAKKYMKELS